MPSDVSLPDWAWPPTPPPAPPVIPGGGILPNPEDMGIPADLWAQVVGPVNLEHFQGNEISGRSEQLLVTNSTSGSVLTSVNVNPAAGDTVTLGAWLFQLSPTPLASVGARRSTVTTLAADGFGAARPTIFARRFKAAGLQPGALSGIQHLCGLWRWPVAETYPVDGVGVVFDLALGAWVVRTIRGGVAVDGDPMDGWDDDVYHVAGYLHRGADVIPFYDGVAFDPIAGAQIQPSIPVIMCSHGLIIAATEDLTVASETVDWCLWGR